MKISKIEDIIGIVGINNYTDSLMLNKNNLSYTGYIINDKLEAILNFQYKDNDHIVILKIGVNNNHEFTYFYCSCAHTDKNNHCRHTALLIEYLNSNPEILEEVFSNLGSSKDIKRNKELFSSLEKDSKEEIKFEFILKREKSFFKKDSYTLTVKIGEDNTYVLNQKLPLFLANYKEKGFELPLGKYFTYSSDKHTVREEDEKILEFMKIYFHDRIKNKEELVNTQIVLSDDILKSFLSKFKYHSFEIQNDYYNDYYSNIKQNPDFGFLVTISGSDLKLTWDEMEIEPFTSDYKYIKYKKDIYELSNKEAIILFNIINNPYRSFYFDEQDGKKFFKNVYPVLKKFDKGFKLGESARKLIIDEKPIPKFYIDEENNSLTAKVVIKYGDYDISLLDDNTMFDNVYLIRDKNTENKCLEILKEYGFKASENLHLFTLSDVDLIAIFLTSGIKKLSSIYQVYVKKELSGVSLVNNSKINNNLSIGSDNIFSYQFKIDGISREEISKLVTRIRDNKKYYRLDNGKFLSLDQTVLRNFVDMIDILGIDDESLKSEEVKIPSYQLMKMDDELMDTFTEFINPVRKLKENFRTYKDVELKIDSDKNYKLRDYQKDGIKWMHLVSHLGFGGVLADEMGLGKSLQTIAYIDLKLQEDINRKFLIIVPTSLVYNWEREFQKFAPNITYRVIQGTKNERVDYLKDGNTKVYLTTYGLLKQDFEFYQDILFHTLILDEAQAIKNMDSQNSMAVKKIKSAIKFALTGTPIENSVMELWNIFDFIMPGYLKNQKQFKNQYLLFEDENYLKLKQQIKPFILRRRKKDVLKELPNKIENTIYVELSEEQKKRYISLLEQTKKELNSKDGKSMNQIKILALLMKLRQLCIEPKLLFDDYKGENAKKDMLIKLVKEITDNEHKILLFSQFPSALTYVKKEFEKNDISYYYLDGQTKSKTRMELVDKFNSDDTEVFLISLKAGGTGLNLTSADVVIHYDPWWNPQVENQATDRTHRIGQTNVVEVMKIITKGTIEEKILKLQNEKRKISDMILDGNSNYGKALFSLSETELEELLEF